jgi:hypothetical protein
MFLSDCKNNSHSIDAELIKAFDTNFNWEEKAKTVLPNRVCGPMRIPKSMLIGMQL